MKKIHLLFIMGMLVSSMAYSQLTIVNLDASSNGQVFSYDSTNTVSVQDNGGEGRYVPGDYYVSVTSTCSPFRFFLQLDELDIDCHDTLFIYDGPSTSSPVLAKINNCTVQIWVLISIIYNKI